MKVLLRFIAFLLVFAILFVLIFAAFPDQFGNAYQRILVRQYDYLKSVKDREKIVFIGASAMAFGYNIDQMEKLTGKPCPLIGNNLSFGFRYLFQMVKPFLNPGDTVVVAYENGYSENMDGYELLLTGIGKRFDMYRYFSKDMFEAALSVYPNYLEKNIKYFRSVDGYCPSAPYSADAFNEKGSMTFFREECLLSEGYATNTPEDNEEGRGYADFKKKTDKIDPESFRYYNEFADFCRENGINIYFTINPEYSDVVLDQAEYTKFYVAVAQHLSAPMISNAGDYLFPRDYIYDAVAHCTTAGAEYRTNLLFNDLKPYI